MNLLSFDIDMIDIMSKNKVIRGHDLLLKYTLHNSEWLIQWVLNIKEILFIRRGFFLFVH